MKNCSLLKKFLALSLALLLLVLPFSSCSKKDDDKKGEDVTEEDEIKFEVPEVDLEGDSLIRLLDRGDKAVVRIANFDISEDFIMTYLKKTAVDSGVLLPARTAAQKIATIYYRERALVGSDFELKEEDINEIINTQLEDYDKDLEANTFYIEGLGINKEIFMDFVNIAEVEAFLDARYLDEIYDYVGKAFKKRYGKEGTAAEISEYYPNFMLAVVRQLDFKQIDKNALKRIDADFKLWVETHIGDYS